MVDKQTIENALKGIAIGDAFGVGIEFKDKQWIAENVDFTKFIDARSDKNIPSTGEYSDDTEHSIGVVKALMDKREFSRELLLEYWKNEYDSDKNIKGYGRIGHGGILGWYEGKKNIEQVRDLQRLREYPGNAPPMRAVPLGFIDTKLINRYAIINADTTHPHPKARAASIVVARASEYMLVKNGNPNKIITYCMQFIDEEEMLNTLEDADALKGPESISSTDFEKLCGPQPIPFFSEKGIIIHGLPCDAMRTAVSSVYIIKHSDNAMDGLKRAIRFGGDVDSIAAISTGILAGRYKINSIPRFMLEKTEGLKYIEGLSERFYNYLK